MILKKLAAAGLATSIAFAAIVLAPMTASAQVTIGSPPSQPFHQVIRGGSSPMTPTVGPAVPETAKDKARECSAEAAAKGLKGKPRKAFVAKCKKA